MKRLAPALVVALLAIGAYLLPRAPTARLSALASFELLAEEVEVGDREIPLWQLVLESDAAQPMPGGGKRLMLQGVAHNAPAELGGDMLDHAAARNAILRGLRQYSADSEGFTPLEIDGAEFPVADSGANFDISVSGGKQTLRFFVDGQEPLTLQRDWTPPG